MFIIIRIVYLIYTILSFALMRPYAKKYMNFLTEKMQPWFPVFCLVLSFFLSLIVSLNKQE
jgi:hypothetical protein